MPRELAARLVYQLESVGATFSLNDHGRLHAALDGVPADRLAAMGGVDTIAATLLALKNEIKKILRERRVRH